MSGVIEQLALTRKLLDDAPVPEDRRMAIPTLWMEPQTSTAVQVREAFMLALAPDIFAEIAEVSCGYDLIDDSVRFTIKRKRDGEKVMMPVPRSHLLSAEPASCVEALTADREMFASLILFLA